MSFYGSHLPNGSQTHTKKNTKSGWRCWISLLPLNKMMTRLHHTRRDRRVKSLMTSSIVDFVIIAVVALLLFVQAEQQQQVQDNIDNNNKECEIGLDGTCVTDAGKVETTDTENGDLGIATTNGWKITTDDDGVKYIDIGFGVGQQAVGQHSKQIQERLLNVTTYMNDRVLKASNDNILHQVAAECQLRHELCTFWAVIDECDKNPAYMKLQCAPACYTCEHLSFDTRCPMPENVTDVFGAGDLHRMFERIVVDPYYTEQYTIEILSQPTKVENTDTITMNTDKNDKPWVITVDNFLTEEECDTLIRLGAEEGYKQSLDVGARKFDGTFDSIQSPGRTSTNAWCQNECFNHTITQHVLWKIENLTAIPDINSEYLQLLKYEETQFYQQHHDYIDFHKNRAQGVRILTVFLYLNDVEKGGGTNFPKLSMTVLPKRGRALIWPSVQNSDPSMKDPRTDHQALPVEQGVKYGANAWIHLRDFKTPHSKNCI